MKRKMTVLFLAAVLSLGAAAGCCAEENVLKAKSSENQFQVK